MYPNNPMLQQSMAQLDQEYAQKRANLMQNFYNQAQNAWSGQNANAQATAPASPQNVNWIQVSGIEGAKNQIVQPGQTAWMMDNNAPYFYVKSVDGVGSSTFRVFQFSEVSESMTNQPEQPQTDASQYVQRDEFDILRTQIEQLIAMQEKCQEKENKGVQGNGKSANGNDGRRRNGATN